MADDSFQPPPDLPDNFQAREAPPKTLGRYRILNEVGRGATAYVYKAYDPQLDRFLAIKVLRQELALDADYREAFLKEARLAAQLTHPGIVTIFDVGVAENKPYIGMELLEGATLEQVLETQGQINLRTVLAMSLQLARALSYAHKQGVVHRDIKPGNIVVLKDKKTVKLTDFGIAQIDENLSKAGRRSDKVLGTPEYMAPEQVLGHAVESRSDLYSMGVLIYRMLVGLPPFVSDDLGQLFKQIVKNKPPPVYVDEEKVKDDVQDLIRKLLKKQPQKRYKNAAQLSHDIVAIQNKLGGNKATGKKGFISLRLRWTATMAGVVFISMCIGLAIVYFMQYRALSGITFDYGRTIARMIAFESSEALLLEDSVGLNALVRESTNNEQLKLVNVINNEGVILASSQSDLVGQQFVPPPQRDLKDTLEGVKIYQREVAEEQVLFDVEMPVVFADKPLGNLYVSFSADSMYAASKTTLVTMLMVMMITLAVVFIITLLLARRTSQDYKRVTQALNKLSLGRVDARLLSGRNDEAGDLFSAFNRLANFLENRFERHVKPSVNDIKKVEITAKPRESSNDDATITVELDIAEKNKKSN